jgi:hypothetical protein
MVFVDETLAGWSGEALADVTRARRMARAVEIAEFHRAADAGVWMGRGFRSPSTWLATATGETVGACKRALHLGKRLTSMPDVARAFASGDLSEPALGLLADAWSEQVAEAFARDEEMLLGWAIRLPYHDAKIVIGAWTAHTDPDHESSPTRSTRRWPFATAAVGSSAATCPPSSATSTTPCTGAIWARPSPTT